VEHVACAQNPEQSYALYLPSNYSPQRYWPILYSFDPAARGAFPLQIQKEAAERYGYILAASNNSHNGPMKPQLEAAKAMVEDTRTRFAVDDRRTYFTGFSGGARVAALLALACKCAAGVLLSGAGFPVGNPPARETPFATFSAIGKNDFNYMEVIPLQEQLEKTGYPHWVRFFDGTHQWAPADVTDQALAWFRVQSMKTQQEPRDRGFLDTQFAAAKARMNAFEQSGDPLSAWRESLQIVATFDSLADVSAVRAKAEMLGADKAVRDALKRERNDFEEQSRLESQISSGIAAPRNVPPEPGDFEKPVEERVDLLRQQAEAEKKPDRKVVLQRALSGVMVGAMESGFGFLEQKDLPRAVRAFLCATEADPQSQWAWSNLAAARALSGDKKGTMNALRRARELSKDEAAFSEWLQKEPAFERLRTTSEFQSILKSN
jgi:dienelactone hydrolase